jgi:putative intracellular protease/amidase
MSPTATRGKVLFILSGASLLTMKDGSYHPTGYWSEELLTPYRAFRDDGYRAEFATPVGHPPLPDERSLHGDEERQLDEIPGLGEPLALDDVDGGEYAAVFVPGGHAPLEDLATDAVAGRLLTGMLELGRPVGALCHGPAAMLAARREDGSPTFAGYRMTAFTDQEEQRGGLAGNMRFLLQDKLEAMGADFVAGAPFEAHIENDRNLHTGQNPQSSTLIAAGMLAALDAGGGL